MTDFMTPRSLVYKDIESFDYFLGEKTELTLEREFFNRLIKLPFIDKSDNPPRWILEVFNNSRYIYYLIKCEENRPSLCFNIYLAIAAEGIEDIELKGHITIATMALVYNWLSHDLRESIKTRTDLSKYDNIQFDKSIEIDDDIQSLCDKIYCYFSEEKEGVTADSIRNFHRLLLNKSDLPTNIEKLFYDLREIEEAALNAPILDVAKGIDYLIECYDPQNGTNGEHYLFLNKILNRLKNEKYPANDSEIIENAKAIVYRRLKFLESAPEPESFSLGLSIDDIRTDSVGDELEIAPRIKDCMGWVIDIKKAKKIIDLLRKHMEGKTKPKDLLMCFCAALEAGVIRKPTFQEYNIVFEDHPIKSEDSFNRWIDSGGARRYKETSKTKTIYNHLVKLFAEIED